MGGAAPGGQEGPDKLKAYNVWDVLEKVLSGQPIEDKKEEKPQSPPPAAPPAPAPAMPPAAGGTGMGMM